MRVFCGIDWAESHHDIALVDQDGDPLAKMRISDDAAGFHALLELLALPLPKTSSVQFTRHDGIRGGCRRVVRVVVRRGRRFAPDR
ncbi:transposase [Streptomyces sp. NBC_01190]|uniref:IS110 family transposase n=1 Tax=Streptomyces sp. NBC_01190 TaxID=2903767 RepID=UPI0038682C8A